MEEFKFNKPEGQYLLLDDAIRQALEAVAPAGMVGEEFIHTVGKQLAEFVNDYAVKTAPVSDAQSTLDEILNGFAEIFPNEGWTTEPHPEIGDMGEETASLVLRRVKLLKSHQEMSDEAVTQFKKILVSETERLRSFLQADRDRLNQALLELFPHEFTEGMLQAGIETTVNRVIRKLWEQKNFADGGGAHVAAISEELQRLRRVLECVTMAADGTLPEAHLPEFKEGHPHWSEAAQKVIDLRASAASAILMANQRNTRAKRFHTPEFFAQIHYTAYARMYNQINGDSLPDWDHLTPPNRMELIGLATVIQQMHSEAMDGHGQEEDPIVLQLIEEGNILTRAVDLLVDLRKGEPYNQLSQLDAWLQEAWPTMVIQHNDPAMDAVRRALELLKLMRTYWPEYTRQTWESVIRPSIHTLSVLGIDILPKGTIVYGAQPHSHSHGEGHHHHDH